jgi:heme/copper-type cytochrome/quinol oxidase subunit 4
MKLYPFCDPYVWENIKVLLVTGLFVKQHKHGKCASEYVNNIILVFILAFAFGTALTLVLKNQMSMLIMLGLAFIYSIPSVWELIQMKSASEGFTDAAPVAEVYDVIGSGAAPATLTLPTARNPFMNILVDEFKYHPTRPMAASVTDPSVKVALDDFFRTEFTADPTDVFGRSQSQRQFVSVPSTSIPNDQGSYQDWLYKIPGKTCKEGGREACLPGTDGWPITWLNVTPA